MENVRMPEYRCHTDHTVMDLDCYKCNPRVTSHEVNLRRSIYDLFQDIHELEDDRRDMLNALKLSFQYLIGSGSEKSEQDHMEMLDKIIHKMDNFNSR